MNGWRDHAACTGLATAAQDPWHPHTDTHDPTPRTPGQIIAQHRNAATEVANNIRIAKAICSACPVRVECATEALEREGDAHWRDRYGIWGGLSPRERAQLAQAAS